MTPSSREVAATEAANYSHLVSDIAWFGLGWAAVDRFRAMYALHLGADEYTLNFIAAMPALLLALSATFSLWWRERHVNSVRAILVPTFVFRLIYILPAFATVLPGHLQIPWLIFAAALPGIGQGLSAVLFVVCMQESVAQERMTQLFSRRSVYFNIALALSAVGFGIWLEAVPFPMNYNAMFVVSFGMTLVSMWHVLQLKPIHHPVESVISNQPRQSPWKSKAFRNVVIVMAVTFAAFTAVNALIPMRLRNELGATESYIALFGLLELLAGALASAYAPRLVKRLGYYGVIVCGMAANAVGAAVLGISENLTISLIAGVISGAGWMLVAMVAVIGLYTESVPVADATRFGVAYHQVYGIVLFLAPFSSNLLVSADLSLSTILMIGAALRLAAGIVVGGIWLASTGRTPRSALKSFVARVHL
jgi:MFS family permease